MAGRVSLALGGALLLLALLWVPWRPAGGRPPAAVDAPAVLAATVISGTVVWKGTDTPVGDVRVVLKDPEQGTVLAEARTDATGAFFLSTGVGRWYVDVPSTDQYWGYSQAVVAYPHDAPALNFGITIRPPAPPSPTPGPTNTPTPAMPAPTSAPPVAVAGLPAGAPPAGTTGSPPAAKLPPAGHPGDSRLPAVLGLLGAALLAVGGVLGRQERRGRRARQEGRS